jgi:hypothetical protein
MAKPVFYRWVFSPSDGQVRLSHNQEGHPAHIRTHKDLANEANEHGCVHGYAFRMGDDQYRVLDYAHKPLVDPYIKVRVKKAVEDDAATHG